MSKDKIVVKLPDGRTIMMDGGKTVKLENGKSVKISTVPPQNNTTSQKPPIRIDRDIQLREENVQEILTAIPHWMIRWGNTLFFSLIVLLLFLAWMVKYPEIITAKATIINQFPKQEIFLPQKGEIEEILVNPGDQVKKGDLLFVLKSEGNHEHLLQLKFIVDTVQLNSSSFSFPFHHLPTLALGNLQLPFARFEASYLLYKSKNQILQNQRKKLYAQATDDISTIQLTSSGTESFKNLIQGFQQLKDAVQAWEDDFTVKAAFNGTVQQSTQEVRQETTFTVPFMTVEPIQEASFVAHLEVPVYNSGKLKPEQIVSIKLDNYPEMEFGLLAGVITKIAHPSPEPEKGLVLEASLPKQLKTSYGKKIEFQSQLTGSGNIVVKNTRLIERFFSAMNR